VWGRWEAAMAWILNMLRLGVAGHVSSDVYKAAGCTD
jgi:hypothetical protein